MGWGGPWTDPSADAICQILIGFPGLFVHLGQLGVGIGMCFRSSVYLYTSLSRRCIVTREFPSILKGPTTESTKLSAGVCQLPSQSSSPQTLTTLET